MATIGYKGALGGMAKDAIKGAGNALVGGLKGAVLREMPAVTAGMAFGKELSKRANAPKMKSGDTPPPVNEQTSTSPAMGGFGASVTLVAGQNKSNVINLEQVRQLKQLNDAVVNQSKLISFQIADQKRKDQFAEEIANEQAVRDDALLQAIKNLGGGGRGGGKKGAENEKGGGGGVLGLAGEMAASAAGGAAGSWLKSIGLAIVSGVTTAAVAAFAFFRNSILSLARNLVLSAALRFGPMAGAASTAAAGAITLSAGTLAALAALIVGLLFPRDAGAAKGKHADTVKGRDAAIDPEGAKQRQAAEDATQKRVPSRKTVGDSAKWYETRESKEKLWDEKYGKTHDPVTGLLKDPRATTIYRPPADGTVTSNFGEKRKDATGKETKPHEGVDIGMAVGSEVRPIAGGKVTSVVVGSGGAAGTYVQVTHPDGKVSEYMHLKEALAKVGDEVTLASVIGKSGGAKGDVGSGHSTGPHLHLQLKDAAGQPIDPSSLPGLAGLVKGKKVSPEDNTPKSTPSASTDTGKKEPKKRTISNDEADNYYKSLGITGTGKGSTSNIGGNDFINNQIADRMDAEANNILSKGITDPKVQVIDDFDKRIKDALEAVDEAIRKYKKQNNEISGLSGQLSAEQIAAIIPDFSRRYPGIQLASLGKFNFGGGGGDDWDGNDKIVLPPANTRSLMGGGTGLKFKKEKTEVIDKDNLDVAKKQLAQSKLQAKSGTALSTKEGGAGTGTLSKVLKPLFRNNSDIIEDTNKTFLQQFRSTATSAFTQAITKGLFPNGFGVSAATAGRDDNYRGQQLQKIFGTDKVINEATTKLLGDQYGPMFAPLFNNLAQGYLEVGSRIAGRTVFQDLSKFGIGGLGAKETHELTGQIFGNFAAGNKKLALEQLLYGASGGKESGIALGPETLFAKYGFKNPAEGIQYFSSVLGEQVTQPFSKLMGADDRSKSVVWNPRAGANGTGAYVYVDSGREATAADIKASGNYGAPVNPTSVSNVLGENNNYRDPYGPGGPRNIVNGTYTSAGAASAYRQVVDPNTNKMVAPTKRQILNLTNEEYMRDKVGNDQKADIQIQLMREDADKTAKFHAETLAAAREAEAKRVEAAGDAAKAAQIRSDAEIEKNVYITKNGADRIVVAVEEAAGTDGKGGGSNPKGLEPPKEGDIVRKSGQLFGGTADGKGGVSPLTGMQEIGNFAFDMAKNAAGSALTKDIKNPYMQMIANFAIQKGMNMGIDYLMKSGGIGDTLMNGAGKFLGDAASSAGDWIMKEALPGITSWFTGLFADGGPVVGPGSGTSDSIPSMLSNGEFVINAKATKENMALLTAINSSGLTQGFATGGTVKINGTKIKQLRIDERGGGQDPTPSAWSGMTNSEKAAFFDANPTMAKIDSIVDSIFGFTSLGSIINNFIDPTGPQTRAAIRAGSYAYDGFSGARAIGNLSVDPMTGLSPGELAGSPQQGQATADQRGDGSGGGYGSGNGPGGSGGGPGGFGAQAAGGPITGPGSGTSDSIPAMLSNGEFVVNAKAAKAYRPILDALNLKHYADGTGAAVGSVKDLSKALGTAETNNQLATSNDTLASIDNSLLKLSGGGTGSGTSVSSYGGGSWDIGLGSPSGGSVSSGGGGATVRQGVSRSSAPKPSTMDYVTSIGGSILKSFAISQGIGMASTALFGATPMALAGNFISGAQLGMAGFTPATFVGPLAPGAATGLELFAPAATESLAAPVIADAVGASALGSIGSSLVAAAPYLLAAVAVFAILDSYGGGGGGPPPKEPKFHAAIYVAGNNNILAIATILETQEYHAVPDVYKTVAYGLLKVAFNATKTSEKITNTNAPYDWVYIKVQFDRVSMLWGKGAPNASAITDDNATEVKRWPALEESTNLNAYAVDIIGLVRDEFKKTASAENLTKLDKIADGLGDYSLHSLSSGLVQDLSSGKYKLDTSIEKGIYADNVAESNRIGELVNAAAKHGAYMSTAMAAQYDEEGNITQAATAGGVPMVWSVKDGAFVENKYPGALILDSAGRPVYDIEGTSAGLTTADFVSSAVAGANRPANVLLPPPATAGAGGAGSTTVVTAPKTTIDNSSVTNFYNSLSTVTDVVRSTTNQVGVVG